MFEAVERGNALPASRSYATSASVRFSMPKDDNRIFCPKITAATPLWMTPLIISLLGCEPLACLAQSQQYDDVPIKTVVPLESTPSKLYTVPAAPLPTPRDSVAPQLTTSDTGYRTAPSSDSVDRQGSSLAAAAATGGAGNSGLSFSPADAGTAWTAQSGATAGSGTTTSASASGNAPSAQERAQQVAQKTQDLAQAAGISPRRSQLPGVVGTVKIRKAFKLFVTEQLIHNLSFRDTPVKEVIAEIARRGNLNILIDKSVTGKITGELRDVTLNEAMDSVLAAAGLQHRTLDNNTVIIASLQAAAQLGLNRSVARVFKLSYAHPYDVAMILHASVFNRGMLPDYTKTSQRESTSVSSNTTSTERRIVGGGAEPEGTVDSKTQSTTAEGPNADTDSTRDTQVNRPDLQRTVRGSSRSQTQEGVGFNNAATDPGSQQIRSFQEVNTDYIVEQNGGGAIVIPDTKNRQVMVVGTIEDLQIAEEAIRMLDRRPKQVHIQASLVELSNQAVRELGANLSLQGLGASTSVLGNSQAPLVQYLPGLGSSFANTGAGFPAGYGGGSPYAPPSVPFSSNVTSGGTTGTAFSGLLGTLLSSTPPTIAGIIPALASQTGFNFLTLSRSAGGNSNIATYPLGANLSLNLLLQTNKAKLVANPSVVVVDDTETLITIASEVVHKITSTVSLGVVTTNVELTKAGIFLNVLPRITEDGFIVMRLRPQVSTPLGAPETFGSATAPTTVTLLNVREIMSQEVRVKDGQTLVLGGLFTEQEASQLSKVPYLAEAPVLGALFRNSLKGRNRTELMLLLTPKIVEEDPTAVSETSNPTTM